MRLDNMPGCCTSAVLFSFGEHGEESVVTVEKIHEMLGAKLAETDLGGTVRVGGKRNFFAISVNPDNVRILKAAGFKEVDSYQGIQGRVHILTLHD